MPFVTETESIMDMVELSGVENAKTACTKELFDEMSTIDVRYCNTATYEGLLEVMGKMSSIATLGLHDVLKRFVGCCCRRWAHGRGNGDSAGALRVRSPALARCACMSEMTTIG